MRPEKQGMGEYQREKAFFAQRSILKAFSDGQWHRNKELRETTKLSSRTLSKHLENLTQLQMIERKEDMESGKYPVPVLYKATFAALEYIKTSIFIEESSKNIEPALMETRDPLAVLEIIHMASELGLVKILTELKEHKDMPVAVVQYLEVLFMEMPYKFFVLKLVDASRKIIDELDFDKLSIEQVKRQKEMAEFQLKRLSELGLLENEPR